MHNGRAQSGFTIVELLIVVVVIAILAAITVVAYNGISANAKNASVRSEVASAAKKLETVKLQDPSEQYPVSLSAAGIASAGAGTFQYFYESSDNSFCLQNSNGSVKWYTSSHQKTPQEGNCGMDGMVGWWTFNGNANDSTSNLLHGTTSGVSLTTGQNGQANGAYSFPGSAAYITMGNSTLFNTPELTMSIWAKTTSSSLAAQTLMAKELKQKYRLTPGGITVLASSAAAWTHMPGCTAPYMADTWNHFLLTISSSAARMKVYMNGSLLCDAPGPAITGYTTTDLMVGTYNTSGPEGFSGSLDDARYYNRALSAAEVKGLYGAGAR